MMKHAVASLLAFMACVDSQEYNYNQQGVDWSTGGTAIATCVAGGDYNNQSPIDIMTSETTPASFGIQFNYTGVYRDYTVAQDGHDLVITPNKAQISDADTHINIVYRDTSPSFNLVNYVIKTKAEHTLDGVRNDMEVQVLFTDPDAVDEHKHVMLSFIYKSSPTASADTYPSLKAIAAITPAMNGGVESTHTLTEGMDGMLINMMVKTTEVLAPALTYRGSVTRPNCEEGSTWIVFATAQDMKNSIVNHMVAATKTANDLGNYRVTPGTDGTHKNIPGPFVSLLPYSVLPGSSHAATYSVVTIAALSVACFIL